MTPTEQKKRALLDKARRHPESVTLQELQQLASAFGFVADRTRGSHQQYVRLAEPAHLLSIQPRKGDRKMAKPYQVKQFVVFIEDYLLEEDQ